MTVGNNGESVHDIILDPGSNGLRVRDIATDAGSGWICVYCECLLGVGSQQRSLIKRQNARQRPEESYRGPTSRRRSSPCRSLHGDVEKSRFVSPV